MKKQRTPQGDYERLNKDEELFIFQRRFLSFLCGTIFLFIGLILISVPILSFYIPINASFEEQVCFRVVAFVFAIVLGCPFVLISIFLFTKVRQRYAIHVNREGLFINTDAFNIGFIAWGAIEQLIFNKKHMVGRYGRTLEVILNTNDKAAVQINAIWRLQSKLLRTKFGPRLLISLSFCKGRTDKNAQAIINFWEHYKSGKSV